MSPLFHFRLVLGAVLAGVSFLTLAPRPAHACKPCMNDPVMSSLRQASGMVLGKVTTASSPMSDSEKHGAGTATFEIRIERWIKKPAGAVAKTGSSLPLQLRWDGICSLRPEIPQKGLRAIFFLSASATPQEGVLTGYCSAPFLPVQANQVLLPAEAWDNWGSKPLSLKKFEAKLKARAER